MRILHSARAHCRAQRAPRWPRSVPTGAHVSRRSTPSSRFPRSRLSTARFSSKSTSRFSFVWTSTTSMRSLLYPQRPQTNPSQILQIQTLKTRNARANPRSIVLVGFTSNCGPFVLLHLACLLNPPSSRLAQDLSHPLITSLQQECTRKSCPQMKAGEWLYLCVAHGNDGPLEVHHSSILTARVLMNLSLAMLCH